MEYEEYRGQMAIRRRGKNESKVSFSSIDRIAYMCGTYCYFRRIIFVSRRFAVAVLPFSSNGYYRENVPLNLTYSLLNVSFFFLSRQCPQLPINHRKSALVWIFLLLWCILPSLPTPMVRFCSNNFVRFLFIYCIISWTIYSFWLHFVCCLCFFLSSSFSVVFGFGSRILVHNLLYTFSKHILRRRLHKLQNVMIRDLALRFTFVFLWRETDND